MGQSRNPPRRALSAQERQDWAAYAGKVARLPNAVLAAPPTATPAAKPVAPAGVAPMPPITRPLAPTGHAPVGNRPSGLDTGSWTRLQGGKTRPEGVLDLHGLTVAVAHQKFVAWVVAAHRRQWRCVEIVTGLGRDGQGTIRRELPFWLEAPDIAGFILAAVHPNPNNGGAVRVLLRRQRAAR